MTSMEALASFLGWCTVINVAILLVAALGVMAMRDTMAKMHSRMFGVAEPDLRRAYFQYMANYKIAILMLNLVPYIAVKAMM